jgi:hypothetical protein
MNGKLPRGFLQEKRNDHLLCISRSIDKFVVVDACNSWRLELLKYACSTLLPGAVARVLVERFHWCLGLLDFDVAMRRSGMTELEKAARQAIALICSARLCDANSASSRREMLGLLIDATDVLRTGLEQAEPVVEHRIHPTNIYDFAGWAK